MTLVYYAIAKPGGGELPSNSIQQFELSARTLRQSNPNISAMMFAYDTAPSEIAQVCRNYEVQLVELGPYQDAMQQIHPAGWWALRHYPLLSAWLSLQHLPDDHERVLYVDLDTVFFRNLETLLNCHQAAPVYARAEMYSRRDINRYLPEYVNEDRLAEIATNLGSRFVPPFNAGVVLFNHFSWQMVRDQIDHVLDFSWRILLRLALDKSDVHPGIQMAVDEIACRMPELSEAERKRALPEFPSSNTWLVEEMAMWLTLGELGLTWETLATEMVAQSTEFRHRDPDHHSLSVLHYYYGNMEQAMIWLARASGNGNSGFEAAGQGQSATRTNK